MMNTKKQISFVRRLEYRLNLYFSLLKGNPRYIKLENSIIGAANLEESWEEVPAEDWRNNVKI